MIAPGYRRSSALRTMSTTRSSARSLWVPRSPSSQACSGPMSGFARGPQKLAKYVPRWSRRELAPPQLSSQLVVGADEVCLDEDGVRQSRRGRVRRNALEPREHPFARECVQRRPHRLRESGCPLDRLVGCDAVDPVEPLRDSRSHRRVRVEQELERRADVHNPQERTRLDGGQVRRLEQAPPAGDDHQLHVYRADIERGGGGDSRPGGRNASHLDRDEAVDGEALVHVGHFQARQHVQPIEPVERDHELPVRPRCGRPAARRTRSSWVS